MLGLTQPQRACLQAIADLTLDGVAPTFDEIKDRLGLRSKSGVNRLLTELKKRGAVDWLLGQSRSITIIAAEITPATLEAQSTDALRRIALEARAIIARRDRSAAPTHSQPNGRPV
jgi:repressor LexA